MEEVQAQPQPIIDPKVLNAYLQELAQQRNLMGDRAIQLSGQLAEAHEKIARLEAELAEARRGKPQVVK